MNSINKYDSNQSINKICFNNATPIIKKKSITVMIQKMPLVSTMDS